MKTEFIYLSKCFVSFHFVQAIFLFILSISVTYVLCVTPILTSKLVEGKESGNLFEEFILLSSFYCINKPHCPFFILLLLFNATLICFMDWNLFFPPLLKNHSACCFLLVKKVKKFIFILKSRAVKKKKRKVFRQTLH